MKNEMHIQQKCMKHENSHKLHDLVLKIITHEKY